MAQLMNNEADSFVHKRMDSAYVVISFFLWFPIKAQNQLVFRVACVHSLYVYKRYSHECCSSSHSS